MSNSQKSEDSIQSKTTKYKIKTNIGANKEDRGRKVKRFNTMECYTILDDEIKSTKKQVE